jgi:cytochrome c
MKKIISLAFVFLSTCVVFGQSKTLFFYTVSNSAQAKALWEDAQSKKRLIDTTTNPAKISDSNLKNYNVVVFLNTSVNALNFQQSAELQRFLQAGGGFVGVGSAIERNYKWLWYKKMIGGVLAENQLTNKVQLSLITNATIGKSELPPLWKIDDKPLVMISVPVRCKPVLLDVMGKTWSWHYTTEEGGKMFYTALGGESSAFQNPNLMVHIWSGIEEVSSKKMPDYTKIADTALPSENNFLKVTLSDNLENPLALATLPTRNAVWIEQNGQVKVFDAKKRKTYKIGKIDATHLKAIKLDPEFTENGYIYTFSELNSKEYKIGRMQLMGDSIATMSDFSSQSTTPLAKSITYEFDKYANEACRLPKYFAGKSFRFDNKQGIVLETLDDDGNIKNVEPFLSNIRFDSIIDISFGVDGELYLLENTRLVKINYSEKNRKPIAIASADVLSGNVPLKVKLSSDGSVDYDTKDGLSFEWRIIGTTITTIKEQNPEYTFLKAGIYEVKLKITDNQGESAETSLKIQVNKAPTKKK